MKLVARAVAALALLSLAAPALPCGDMEKAASATPEKKKSASSPVAAKSSAQKKGATPAKSTSEAKPATATN